MRRRSFLLHSVGTSSLNFPTILTSPNSNSLPLNSILHQIKWYLGKPENKQVLPCLSKLKIIIKYAYLATELAEVFAVLTYFHLLDLLPKTGTISSTFTNDIPTVSEKEKKNK